MRAARNGSQLVDFEGTVLVFVRERRSLVRLMRPIRLNARFQSSAQSRSGSTLTEHAVVSVFMMNRAMANMQGSVEEDWLECIMIVGCVLSCVQ